MADARLSIQVSAEVGQFVSGMKQADASMEKSQASAANLANTFSNTLLAALNKVPGSAISTSKAIDQAAAKIGSSIDSITSNAAKLSDSLNLKSDIKIKADIDTGAFKQQVDSLKSQIDSISDIKINADNSDFDASIKEIRSKLSAIDDLSVDITANKSQIQSVINEVTANLAGLKGISLPITIREENVKGQIALLKDQLEGLKASLNTSAFDASIANIQKRIAFLDDVNITANISQAENSVQQLTADISKLKDASLSIQVDSSEPIKAIDAIRVQLDELQDRNKFGLSVDTKGVISSIEALKANLNDLVSKATITGDTSAIDATIQSIRSKIEGIEASVNIFGDTSALDAEIPEIKKDLANLSTSIEVVFNDENIKRQVAGLKGQLALISDSVKISPDSSKFDAAINSIRDKIASIDTRLPIDADTSLIDADLAKIKSDISGLVASVELSINGGAVQQQVDVLKNKLESLSGGIFIGISATGFDNALAEIKNKFNAIDDLSVDITANKSQIDAVLADLENDIRTLSGSVVIKPDTSQVSSAIDSLNVQLTQLGQNKGLTIDTSGIKSSIDLIESEFKSLVSSVKISGSTTELENKISALKEKVISLSSLVVIDGNTTELESKIAEIRTEVSGIGAQIKISVDEGTIDQQIQEIKLQLSTISGSAKIGTDTTAFDVAINEVRAKLATIDSLSVDITANKVPLEAAIIDVSNDLASLKGSVVTINANGQPAIRSINELESELDQLAVKLKSATNPKDLERLGKSAALVREQIRNIGTGAVQGSLQKFSKFSNEATLALSNLGRVAQDAPFGFIGIANNLNPLLESFQRLKVTAGSSGGALKAMAASLTGAGGVGLAVSVVSSLLIVFGDRLFGAKKKTDELGKSTEQIEFEFDKLQKRIGEAAEAISKDAAKISILSDAINSGVLPIKERKKAIEEVLNIYPTYIGKLEQEKQAYDKITVAITDSIEQLATAAQVKALLPNFEQLIQKAIKAQIQLDQLNRFSIARPKGTKVAPEDLFGVDEEELKGEQKVLTDIIRGAKREIENAKKSLATIAGGELNLVRILFGDSLKETDKTVKDVTDDIISRARQFVKEFGNAFVLPNLEDAFFTSKAQLLSSAKDLLDNVKKFIQGETKALRIKLPVLVEEAQISTTITNQIDAINAAISAIKPLKLTTEGDFKQIADQLESLQSKEITLRINEKGNVTKIAEQLSKLTGVEIPIVIEQQGNINKIADQLRSLKNVDIKVTGNVTDVLTDLAKINDVSVSVNLQDEAAKRELDKLTLGKEFPIIINQNGIITQISKAVDGAIRVVQTKSFLIPIITDEDIKIAENLTKETELSKSIIDNFFKSVSVERSIPITVDADFTLLKSNLDLIDKKLDLRAQFNELGDVASRAFNKINFSNITRGIEEATQKLKFFKAQVDAISAFGVETLTAAFATLGEALGTAFAGGSVNNIFKAFATSLGSAIQALGEEFIRLGVIALAAKTALKSLFANPALAIAAGTALVAVGAAFKTIVNRGVQGFEEGGLVFGPTIGLIGEGRGTNRSNPEVIAPLDQLKGFLGQTGGNSQVVIINRRVRGRDQVLQLNREQRSQQRRA